MAAIRELPLPTQCSQFLAGWHWAPQEAAGGGSRYQRAAFIAPVSLNCPKRRGQYPPGGVQIPPRMGQITQRGGGQIAQKKVKKPEKGGKKKKKKKMGKKANILKEGNEKGGKIPLR